MGVVLEEEITPFLTGVNTDWELIQKAVVAKYGSLGEERFWGARMLDLFDKNDWESFGKYYKLYYDRAIPYQRSFAHINNMSWQIAKNVTNREVLKTAVKTMLYDIKKFDASDPNAIDTYAHLLYKIGKKHQAIVWQERAVKLSNNKPSIVATFAKMNRGEVIFP